MKLKKTKTNKVVPVSFRCTEKEFNKLKQKANIYTEGNVSAYLVFAGIAFVPSKDDFEDEGRK